MILFEKITAADKLYSQYSEADDTTKASASLSALVKYIHEKDSLSKAYDSLEKERKNY